MNWFMLQYLNIMLYRWNEHPSNLRFDNCFNAHTHISCGILSCDVYNGAEMVQHSVDFSEFASGKIKEGFAIYVRLNRHCIVEPINFEPYNYNQQGYDSSWSHETLISGYDSEKQEFYLSDFYDNKFRTISIDGHILNLSFSTARRIHTDNYRRQDVIACRTFSDNQLNITYDPLALLFLIERWLRGGTMGDRFLGITCFDVIDERIQKCGLLTFDVRVLSVLYDHTTAVLLILNYLIETGKIIGDQYLINHTEDARKTALICLNLLLKYKIEAKENDQHNNKMRTLLNSLKDKEEMIFKRLHALVLSSMESARNI